MSPSTPACGPAPSDGRPTTDKRVPQYLGGAIPPAVLRQIVDSFQDGVALADDQGIITLASTGLNTLFGYQHDELLGYPVEFLIPSNPWDGHRSLRTSYDRAPRTRPMGYVSRLAALRKDGTTFPAQISLSPVPTAAGRFTLVVVRDLTEIRQMQSHLQERSIRQDRDRIADDLRDKVIQRIFAAGLALDGATTMTTQPEVRRRISTSIAELDLAIRLLRDSIFGLDHQLEGRGFRREIMTLCGELSPAAEVTFTGPVDGVLHPADSTQLLGILRDALTLISRHATPARIGITADRDAHRTVIDATPLSPANGSGRTDDGFAALRVQAAQARIRLDIDSGPYGTRFAWHIPTVQ